MRRAGEVAARLRRIERRLGPVDILVNNAGIAIADGVLKLTAESWDRVLETNLNSVFLLTQIAAQSMVKRKRGKIINLASESSRFGSSGVPSYSASKGGIVGMTLPIARDLARSGIRVCTIAPGIFETPMLMGLPKEAQDSLGKMVPFPPRLGRPAEYAKLVRSVVENEMPNGEVIRLEGAIRRGHK